VDRTCEAGRPAVKKSKKSRESKFQRCQRLTEQVRAMRREGEKRTLSARELRVLDVLDAERAGLVAELVNGARQRAAGSNRGMARGFSYRDANRGGGATKFVSGGLPGSSRRH
jgi:hypothetical protein